MVYGKLIGGLLGFLFGNLILGIVGVFIGHLFDVAYERRNMFGRPTGEALEQARTCFFETVFSLLGHLAKADGRISEQEIKITEHYMDQMGLNADHRREAIRLFKEGAEPEFDVNHTLQNFKQVCGMHPNLVQMLLTYLVNVALSDGVIDKVEENVLRNVATALGIPGGIFEQLLRMIKAQNSFSGSHYQQGSYQSAPSPNQLDLAYEALGVEKTATDAEVKKAYRKLMSQYHPDKLAGQGVPDDMIKEATERSQEIQLAYDLIKKHQG